MALGNSVNASTTGFQSLNASTGVWNGRNLVAGTGISITNTDGTGGNPTISATGSSGGGSGTVVVYEEFLGLTHPNVSTCLIGQYPYWVVTNTNWTIDTTDLTSSHPGMITCAAVATASLFLGSSSDLGTIYAPFILGGGAITLNWIIKINTLSSAGTRYTLRCGFGDTQGADEVNGCYFEYSDNINSGNWVIKTAAASSRTTTNTAVAVTTGFHNLQVVVNAAASSVTFSIDGAAQTPISTNIPTAPLSLFFDAFRIGNLILGSVAIDAIILTQTLTTPR